MEQIKKYEILRGKLLKSFQKLKEVLDQEFDEYIQDSTIQRFEFCFEIFWKTLKIYLLIEGFDEQTPRSVLKKSFEIGLLKEIDVYIDMIDARNMTSHTYDENMAKKIYEFIKNNFLSIEKAIESLPKKI